MLVVDANVVVSALASATHLRGLRDPELVAPLLMWSEARSALHEARWRGELGEGAARDAQRLLESAPIERSRPSKLGDAAWRIADTFGWAKTYDAEYVALAELLGCRLVTLDARLRRACDRLGFVVGPTELD